ncbi:Zinc finger BED domain-containing protein 1 [Merluccius polli]|uniref:Zinc finger BED domain-containing protein 1 n=1 Tax=Merluccius polli TaxID=89951 RepID=A0AA47M645_MERPO|nr:Zinc finger BED domain-containing protein 1 [Merluccius polli]
MVSFNTMEKPSFKLLLKTLNRQYDPPGRKYISQVAIPEMYNKLRSDVQVLISEGHHFALTTDMCLQTSFFLENHTANNLAGGLEEALRDWQLDQITATSLAIFPTAGRKKGSEKSTARAGSTEAFSNY